MSKFQTRAVLTLVILVTRGASANAALALQGSRHPLGLENRRSG
jgi:hypothetical protein